MAESGTLDLKEKKVKNPFEALSKEPSMIVYRLIEANSKIEGRSDIPIYKPLISLKNTDIIKWEDGERSVRYLHGWQSIFVDEQEANGKQVPQNVLDNPLNRMDIIDGEIKVRPTEKTKIHFLDVINANANSKYRTGKSAAIFERFSEDMQIEKLVANQDMQKKAFDKAFVSTPQYVFDYAPKLGISLNAQTGEGRTFDAVFADFKQYALSNPDKFLEICNN